jgi:DNA-binding NarL/FixJ family response regulator
VARLVARGMSNADIAAELVISIRTVTSHLDHIYGRLGVRSRLALAQWLAQHTDTH